MKEFIEQAIPFITMYGIKIIGAIIILIIGRIAAGIGRKISDKILTRSKVDITVKSFVGSLVFTLILVFAVVAALSKFGVETASFIAVLGAGAFAIGFALQGSLADFAAGVLLLIKRPFKVNDFVEVAGVAGTVNDIQLFATIITTPDNIKIVVPNGKINGDVIKNYSVMENRRVDLTIGIGYGSSIEDAVRTLHEVLDAHPSVLKDPAPQVAVAELADSSVNLVVRPWVKSADYWSVRFDLTRQIKEAFDARGIEIPFPQQVVHLLSENAS